MAQDAERAGELYDFLYRDSNRLISYYAQVFEGRLTSIEDLENNRESSQKTGGVNLQVASGQFQKVNEDQFSRKKAFDPHDMNTADILIYLKDNGYIYDDYESAPNGSLILVKGKIFFIDAQLIKTTSSMFTLLVAQGIVEMNDPNVAIGTQVLDAMLEGVPFPPIYFLEAENGGIICGVVKEIGMEESVSTYYLRYGQNSLPEVHLLALKESPEALAPTSAHPFLSASQTLTAVISNLLIPVEAMRATPLVLFRKFRPMEEAG